MKKFIVSGDQHIGLKQGIPKPWQINRYNQLFDSYVSMCKEHEADLILAGDWFEKVEPDPDELEMSLKFFRRLKEEGIETWLIAGNHETISKGVNTFDKLDVGKDKTIKVHFGKDMILPLPEEQTNILFRNHSELDYPLEVNKVYPEQWILISHFRPTINIHIKEEIDVAKLIQPFDLVLAGDIHMPHQEGKLWYTNSPINKIFETNPECGCLLLKVFDGKSSVERIPMNLPALVQVNTTAEKFNDLKLNDTDYYRVEVTGTPEQLRDVVTVKENVKLLKVPTFQEVLVKLEEVKEAQNVSLEDEYVGYMANLNYKEEDISRLMLVRREVVN